MKLIDAKNPLENAYRMPHIKKIPLISYMTFIWRLAATASEQGGYI
jgi:hypothetical protein